MADYLPDRQTIVARDGNVVYTGDGNAWVNYLAAGPLVDPYSAESIAAARRAHDILASSLLACDSDDYIISGFLTPVSAQERLNRAVEGLKDFSTDHYPDYAESLRHYVAAIESGHLEERRRVYIISVRVPGLAVSAANRVMAKLTGSNPFAGVDTGKVANFNRQIGEAIPQVMAPVPAPPDILEWARERACLRGVDLPQFEHSTQAATPPNGAFNDIRIDEAPDSEATVTQFGRRVVAALSSGGASLDKKQAKKIANLSEKSLANYFHSLRKSQVMAISNYAHRGAELPDGPISYQAMAAVGKYATVPDQSINTLTSTVDMALGLDADFTIRIHPADNLADNSKLNETLKTLDREDASNSASIFDTEQYVNEASELLAFSRSRDAEKASRPMKITCLFAFASARLDVLTDRIRDVEKIFAEDGYQLFRPVGGQAELWAAMMPCYPSSSAVTSLAGATTTSQFAAYAPLRRIAVGDGTGFPLGASIENTLGTEVNIDLVNPTARGNASIAISGAQGRGKSYTMKRICGHLTDIGALTVILDGQGEWGTWATRLPSHQIVDLANPTMSIDPLKLIDVESDTGLRQACRMLQALLLPMCNVSPDSEAGAALSRFLTPDYIRGRTMIRSTRALLEHIVGNPGENFALRSAIPTLKRMLADETMGAFVDPRIDGRVKNLPPLEVSARTIVFVTKGLSLPRAGKPEEKMTLGERYTLMANSAVAMVTAWIFDQHRDTSAFVMDEASFYEDLDVLTDLIKTPDRTGRKFGTFVLVGSQTGAELSAPQYKLVRRRICMGQDTLDNAREALEWAGFTNASGRVSDRLVHELVTDTSPLDPSNHNLPAAGRAGECFFNDGTRRGKIKIYPELRKDRERMADTRADRFIRYETAEVAN